MIFDVMKNIGWRERLFKSTRGKILDLLHARECTVNELAEELHLTDNAVRAHLASLERDRLVAQSGLTPGIRLAGRRVAQEYLGGVQRKTRQQRINAALGILKELGGAASFREEGGKHF